MPAIAFGLGSKVKPGQASPVTAGQKRKQNVFGDDDHDTTFNPTAGEAAILNGLDDGVSQPSKSQKISSSTSNSKSSILEFTNLSALHTAKKQSEQANTVDSTMYDYDAVYESFHTPRNGKEDTKGTAPRYMTNLLKSSEVRKRDQLRAKERLLQKEREAEGDDFAGKEKFVTGAYKAQQEEIRKLEKEEADREAAEEAKRKNGGGLTGFYKELLRKDEQRSMEISKAAQEATAKGEAESEEAEDKSEKSAAQVAAELNARGAKVAINDEGEVVDKRQLLSAGLNVAAKPKSVRAQSRNTGAQVPRGPEPPMSANSARQAQRERQTRTIVEQLKNMAEQQAEEEAESRKELLEAARSKKNSEEISSARARYLARKKAQDSEKAKKSET